MLGDTHAAVCTCVRRDKLSLNKQIYYSILLNYYNVFIKFISFPISVSSEMIYISVFIFAFIQCLLTLGAISSGGQPTSFQHFHPEVNPPQKAVRDDTQHIHPQYSIGQSQSNLNQCDHADQSKQTHCDPSRPMPSWESSHSGTV